MGISHGCGYFDSTLSTATRCEEQFTTIDAARQHTILRKHVKNSCCQSNRHGTHKKQSLISPCSLQLGKRDDCYAAHPPTHPPTHLIQLVALLLEARGQFVHGDAVRVRRRQLPVHLLIKRRSAGWQVVGRLLAGCWQAVGRLLAGCWQVVGRLLAGCWQVVGRLLTGCWQVVGRLLTGC